MKEATEQKLLDKLASLESKIYRSGLLFSVVFFQVNILTIRNLMQGVMKFITPF